jgi:hypothetical protein
MLSVSDFFRSDINLLIVLFLAGAITALLIAVIWERRNRDKDNNPHIVDHKF